MPVRIRIMLLFSLLVLGILTLVCGSVYYFSYTNRIKDIQTRLINRAITTARLLSQDSLFDQNLIRKIDASTSVAMRDKVVEAYDTLDRKIYSYSDDDKDTILVGKPVFDEARGKDISYFTTGNKDAIAYYYKDGHNGLIVVAGAYDEAGNENCDIYD